MKYYKTNMVYTLFCAESEMEDDLLISYSDIIYSKDVLSKLIKNQHDFVWTTSWGISTRVIGAIIMSHSDDDGLILPPNIAPTKIVIIPIFNSENKTSVFESVNDQVTASVKPLDATDR